MVLLRGVGLEPAPVDETEAFPFRVPIIAELEQLDFERPVTFLVGENGSGKSTLLESLALASRRVAVGSEDLGRDASLTPQRQLADRLRLVWNRKSARGFFLRAEDFFGYAKRMSALVAEAEEDLAAVDVDYADRSAYVRALAGAPHAKALAEIEGLYGEGLDAQSHGESFLKLFESRLAPEGLYLLDEPEVPLSPLRQLALLALLRDAVDAGSQFIIATHSPILLAFPDARIWSCDTAPMEQVAWEDLEHVTLTRSFLNDPERYLRRLGV